MSDKPYFGAWQYLGIVNEGTPKVAAEVINLSNKKTCTINHRLFDNMAVGSYYTHETKGWKIVPITEEQIPVLLEEQRQKMQKIEDAARKQKEDNIATGRFQYFYTEYNGGKAENIIEFLSDKIEDFWQILTDNLNSGQRTCGRPRDNPLTVDQLKEEERMVKFMSVVQPGDKLEWYTWNGGFLAFSSGPCITRDGAQIAYSPWMVS